MVLATEGKNMFSALTSNHKRFIKTCRPTTQLLSKKSKMTALTVLKKVLERGTMWNKGLIK